jgi:hypothetical protein
MPKFNSQEIDRVVRVLSKMTSRSCEEIKPHLDELLDLLSQKQDNSTLASFYETSTHEEMFIQRSVLFKINTGNKQQSRSNLNDL